MKPSETYSPSLLLCQNSAVVPTLRAHQTSIRLTAVNLIYRKLPEPREIEGNEQVLAK